MRRTRPHAASPVEDRFPELSYASEGQPRLKRWFIRSVEELSGRDRYVRLYEIWRRDIAPSGNRIFGRMLDLMDVRVSRHGVWPPADLPDGPLVLVANHPFGIGDGVAILSLAEQLGRPFRVMIHVDLLKIKEMQPYALPIDFAETKEAVKNNLAVRHEAVRLLKEGVTIVVFPAGGVATAEKGFGRARDLPWKMFPAKMIQEAKACVVPVHFSGQNGRLFHLVSYPMNLTDEKGKLAGLIGNVSLTLRTSLLIREFARLRGREIKAGIGAPIPWSEMAPMRDRMALVDFLQRKVAALDLEPLRETARRRIRLRPRGRRSQSAAAPS